MSRLDSPLFFANSEQFQRRRARAIRKPPWSVRWVIIAAEPITDIDTTAAETLIEVFDELDSRGIRVAFAELKGQPKDRLATYGLYDRVGDELFFPTLGTAIDAYVEDTGSDWVDWSDR